MKTKFYQFILKEREKTARVLEQVAAILQNGGVAIVPSETCYCLAIDATNEAAAEKLKALGVKTDDSTTVVVSDLRMAKEYLNVNETGEKIVHAFMPGPVTLIVELLPDSKLAKNLFSKKAGFRVSSNVFTRALSSELGKPITISLVDGIEPIYELNKLKGEFDGKLDAIVSSGNLVKISPATMVDVTGTELKLIRPGPISFNEINDAIKEDKTS
ncbi:MAG: L-threonylcarbamoyladenylate synthase [Candidatus Micrarchaeota archaeon]